MKYATLNRYGCIAALAFLSFAVHAKPNNNTNAFTKSLSFIENKGQIADQYYHSRKDIDFKLQGNDVTMFVGDGQLHYQWYRSNKKEKSNNEKIGLQRDNKSPSGDLGVGVYRMDVILLGANKNAEIVKEGLQIDYDNYYLPQCPGGVTAHRYSKITYKNIYPNIDWEIETAQKGGAMSQGCKYNFIVHPGGDYRNIKIQYNGATSIALKDGALIATTPMGSITENVPYTYDAATHKEIKSNFILNNNILSYNIALPLGSGEGDRASAFIIDPVLEWASYFGGAGFEDGNALATDYAGNSYISGETGSSSNIATVGAFQTAYYGGLNRSAYIAKFNNGGALRWATYYGGTNAESFWGMDCDHNSNVYVVGRANSTGMASSGAYQTVLQGPEDVLVAKFDSSGIRIWSTYYGGNDRDAGVAGACDGSGNFYIAGTTLSTTGVTTTGAYQTTPGPAFFAKFSSTGMLQFGSYHPGDIYSVCTDNAGYFYIGGMTTSATGIATAGSFQAAKGNFSNGFINKFNSSGAISWGTYYGGGCCAYVLGMTCDAAGNLYIGGQTGVGTGPSNIPTIGAHQGFIAGGADGFLAKFSSTGTPQWGTFYGGTDYDEIEEVRLGLDGNLYAVGHTESSNNIATAGAYHTTISGSSIDLMMLVFSTAGQRLYGTYYGGTSYEPSSGGVGNLTSIAASSTGGILLSSFTTSTSGIATPGAYQTTYAGGNDAFIVKFNADTSVFVVPPYTDTLLCIGDSIHINYGVSQTFRSGNTFTLQLSNASGSFASPTTLATVTSSVGGTFNTVMPVVTASTGYRLRIIASAPADTSSDNGINIKVRPNPTTPVATANTPVCAGQTLNLSSSNSSTGVVWSWIGPNSFTAATQNASIPNVQTNGTGDYIVTANLNGCKRKDTVSVTVNQTPAKPNATSNSPICSGQTLNLFATSTTGGVSWSWAGPGGFNTSAQNPTIPNAQTSNAGSYVVTATLGNCSSSDTEVVVINQGPAVNVYPSPNDTICQGGSVTLVALPISAGTGPTFQWYKNSNPIGGATNTSYSTTPNNGDVYYCRMTPGTGTSCTGAINSNSITMTVLPVTTPSVSISGPTGAQDPYNLLTFHATGTGGGSNPKYQWLRSGQLVQGAIADTWSTQGLYLSQHDTICVILTSSDICAVPKSDTACMVVNILTGVDDVNKNTTIQLYPNPNDGIFTLYANSINDQDASVEISDAVGRVVYQQVTTAKKGNIDVRIDIHQLAAGVYILNLHDKTGRRTLRFVISR